MQKYCAALYYETSVFYVHHQCFFIIWHLTLKHPFRCRAFFRQGGTMCRAVLGKIGDFRIL